MHSALGMRSLHTTIALFVVVIGFPACVALHLNAPDRNEYEDCTLLSDESLKEIIAQIIRSLDRSNVVSSKVYYDYGAPYRAVGQV